MDIFHPKKTLSKYQSRYAYRCSSLLAHRMILAFFNCLHPHTRFSQKLQIHLINLEAPPAASTVDLEKLIVNSDSVTKILVHRRSERLLKIHTRSCND